MSDATYSVHDNGDLHRYRTEIPNIISRLGLTPYELTLYAHLKQTAGDGGQCWKSTVTLARETGMSAGTISKAKDGLIANRPELAGKSLIALREEPGTHGGRPRHYITLTDVWPENMAMRGKVETVASTTETDQANAETPSSPHELGVSQVHHMNAQVHHMNFPSSPHELKKEQSIKKELLEEDIKNGFKGPITIDPLPTAELTGDKNARRRRGEEAAPSKPLPVPATLSDSDKELAEADPGSLMSSLRRAQVDGHSMAALSPPTLEKEKPVQTIGSAANGFLEHLRAQQQTPAADTTQARRKA